MVTPKKLILGSLAVLTLGGCSLLPATSPAGQSPKGGAPNEPMVQSQNQSDVLFEDNQSSDSEMMETKTYTLADIAAHSTPQDCWLAIEGKVYNVSNFGETHPGEDAVYFGCGKDATSMFNARGEEKEPHSEKARSFLPNFEIGTLVQE